MKTLHQTTNDNPPQNHSHTTQYLASCRKLIAQMELMKETILAQFRDTLETHEQVLRLALNEAEALAWQTAYPHLVFPALALEKAQTVSTWHARQRLLDRTTSLFALAA